MESFGTLISLASGLREGLLYRRDEPIGTVQLPQVRRKHCRHFQQEDAMKKRGAGQNPPGMKSGSGGTTLKTQMTVREATLDSTSTPSGIQSGSGGTTLRSEPPYGKQS